MTTEIRPRYVTSVLVEEGDGAVTVTWGLGDVIDGAVEFFGYGVDYYGVDGNGGKRFGVRFGTEVSGHVFEWTSNTQANYDSDSVTATNDSIVVFYRDADIGLTEVGTIKAFSHLNGGDIQTDLPVTLLR
jgi:hypothetical protein